MTKEMLEAAGIPGKEGRFPEPPTTTYAVYFSDVTADGPDGYNCLFTHNDTVELYEPKKEDAAPSAFEAELDARESTGQNSRDTGCKVCRGIKQSTNIRT